MERALFEAQFFPGVRLITGEIVVAEKAIVLGEGMPRAIAAARGIGAKWYQAWSKFFPKGGRMMSEVEFNAAKMRNAKWLNSKIDQGYKVYDIGIDATRTTRSPFYQLEQDILRQRNYPVTKLP